MRSKLSLTLLSLYKIYGFGDYFLQRQCVASRDPDICDYENAHNRRTYESELETRLAAIGQVSEQDAQLLRFLSQLWGKFYDALYVYTEKLKEQGIISSWRASFVRGIALQIQTGALLNLNYDHDEFSDESLEDADPD